MRQTAASGSVGTTNCGGFAIGCDKPLSVRVKPQVGGTVSHTQCVLDRGFSYPLRAEPRFLIPAGSVGYDKPLCTLPEQRFVPPGESIGYDKPLPRAQWVRQTAVVLRRWGDSTRLAGASRLPRLAVGEASGRTLVHKPPGLVHRGRALTGSKPPRSVLS